MNPEHRLAWVPDSPGTYALVFECNFARRIRIGALGRIAIEPGFYVYCGSAFGPGGLRARIRRHLRRNAKKHWHIDYLRPFLRIHAVWYSTDPRNLEHAWANRLLDIAYRTTAAVVPLKGFGASDCRCTTHLVRLPFAPRPADLSPAGPRRRGIVAVDWRT